MTIRPDLIYLFDGTFEGLMTAVFEAYAHRPAPAMLLLNDCQTELGKEYVDIAADMQKASRVVAGIRKTIGNAAYDLVWDAFLYGDELCGNRIYRYLLLGFEQGRRIWSMLTDERVMQVDKCARLVRREASYLLEFVRFSEMEGGVYYAAVSPEYAVLPLIMPHFVNRFHIQPFLIHDRTHALAGVWDTHEWVLRDTQGLVLPELTENERELRRLWKTFYDTVAIKERVNPALRRQHMPKKYWKHITELQPDTALSDKKAGGGQRVLEQNPLSELPQEPTITAR